MDAYIEKVHLEPRLLPGADSSWSVTDDECLHASPRVRVNDADGFIAAGQRRYCAEGQANLLMVGHGFGDGDRGQRNALHAAQSLDPIITLAVDEQRAQNRRYIIHRINFLGFQRVKVSAQPLTEAVRDSDHFIRGGLFVWAGGDLRFQGTKVRGGPSQSTSMT